MTDKRDLLEMIALVNAGISSTDPRVQGLTGGLTGLDIGYALHGLPEITVKIGELKGARKEEHRGDVLDYLTKVAQRQSVAWKGPYDTEIPRKLAVIVLGNECPNKRCGACGGVKERLINHKTVICDVCHGDSWQRMARKDIYKYLGVTEGIYRQNWQDKIKRLTRAYKRHEEECEKRIKRYLRG